MKPYSKYENVLANLTRHIQAHRRSMDMVLEGERTLVTLLGTSRKTLAKAMDTLEAKGVLQREPNFTRILPGGKQKHRYAYTATAHRTNGNFWYASCGFAWDRLKLLLAQNDMTADLVFYDPENPGENEETLFLSLKDYDCIFNALALEPLENDRLMRRLRDNAGVQCVAMGETLYHPEFPMITPDFYQSGVLAAEHLLNAGYRNPIMMATMVTESDIAFSLRICGFRETIEKAGGTCEKLFFSYQERLESVVKMNQYLSEIKKHGRDSVFFAQDTWIDLAVEPLYAAGLVPDPIGIVAINSTQTATAHIPSIAVIDSENRSMADEMLSVILSIENGTFEKKPFIKRFPVFITKGLSIKMKEEISE